jgi:hypothetical protein
MNDSQLVFIISLPRSGTTLLQKLLMAHSEISSVGEPWIILPLAYTINNRKIKAEYGYETYKRAQSYIFKQLPYGKEDYIVEIRNFVLNIYDKLKNDTKYFIDKTPRYYFIIPEIYEIFPNAKFIFLLRNPTGIFSSYIEAFNNNSIKRLFRHKNDLLLGPKLIAEGIQLIGKKCITITYEELVCNPTTTSKHILSYLNLDYENQMIDNFFNQEIIGLGDHLGVKKYSTIRDQQKKWKGNINTPIRRSALIKYINQINDNYLFIGQYDRESILSEIRANKTNNLSLKEYIWFIEDGIIQKMEKILSNYSK